ncbi:PRC-barrel domain-containing protein [Paenibacillus sonchi]|uniref:Photosystem reaction center subunit H n=4 Tax=Paenibacillus TaxID=44249 RepID=A0A1G9V855_9BACL|nr:MULTISPECIES: PRC-barrel domain-containing protein [Paenibacillus]KWX76913.1 photosystem reaction center subunit H [Paenibacillus jilunlii]KWX77025.1 photosystem reaction center subunit H [Paenibacillus riograndensis]KWX85048.1 photosystem reaction center subunit H [Paenibacillus riograndensis]MCE3202683.1 PRC-barrel domain-containing protein [Paenibacillus sonchi]QQZ61459.1 PRC-barrel domain-containing protein [Paenibacillus sonchi]
MKLQEMIGLAVYEVEEGNEIGKIVDILLDSNWNITGIELESKAFFSSHVKVVAWEDIVAYGEDAVMIRSKESIVKADTDHIPYTFLLGKKKLKDLQVLTASGTILGRVSDVYFDQKLGNTIVALEISDGLVTDLIEGRKWLPCSEGMSIGENSVLVPAMSEERLQKAINIVNG